MSFRIPDGYTLIQKKDLADIHSAGYLLQHEKSGARVLCIENQDQDKVFNIAFRTPPKDHTGVAHILEHSVLCGSEKYPPKDPFIELVKGSMNTFLNAMTFPDKTMYPLSSCNAQDFKNLMSVYMDAVFHPNIYKTKIFFEQEGWHYEMEDEDAPLVINGVVYNEMKGAYSSPESWLELETDKALYPDTPYAFESGGFPERIPDLTYEDYLAFHKKYYHPSNAYIYLYGNMDFEERLTFMAEEYLNHYEKQEIDSEISLQKPFDKIKERTAFYGITEDEKEEKNTYFSLTKVVGDNMDRNLVLGMNILENVLLATPGAPLKRAILDAGFGVDVFGGYENTLRQPNFEIGVKGADPERAEEFKKFVKDELLKICEEKLSEKSILAAINSLEFKSREADFGGFSKGLIYGIDIFKTWLYDDAHAMDNLSYSEEFEFAKKAVGTGYYEELIRKYLIENEFGVFVQLIPKKNYNEEQEEKLTEKLSDIRNGFTKEERKKIADHTEELHIFQDTPSSKEELETIPMIKLSDIDKKGMPLHNEEKQMGNVKAIYHDLECNGISYYRGYFDASFAELSDVPYLMLLRKCLGLMDTENYKYQELADQILLKTGGMSFSFVCYQDMENQIGLKVKTALKVLEDQMEDGISLMEEIMLRTDFSDQKRMKEIISQTKVRLQDYIVSRGDSVAEIRAASYQGLGAYITDLKDGIAFYQFIEKLDEEFEERFPQVKEKLKDLSKKLFRKDNLLISFTGSDEDFDKMSVPVCQMIDHLSDETIKKAEWKFVPEKKNEAIKTASQINYAARVGNYTMADAAYQYCGAMSVLQGWLNYEYLWINIRAKGGAYGCSASFSRLGGVLFSTYRDPKVKESLNTLLHAADAVKDLELSDRDLLKYIIGAINKIDSPLSPAGEGDNSMSCYLRKITDDMLLKTREEILSVTIEDLRGVAEKIQAAMDQDCLCVIGNAKQLEENKELFTNMVTLFH